MKKITIDCGRIWFFLFALVLAILATIYGYKYVAENKEAIGILINVYSILAGFLVAIIAIIGDVALMPKKDWKEAQMARKNHRNRLLRHEMLFYLYLLTLLLIFISTIIPKEESPVMKMYAERAFIFFATFAFVLSMKLPSSLVKMHQERIDDMIESMKDGSGKNGSEKNGEGK